MIAALVVATWVACGCVTLFLAGVGEGFDNATKGKLGVRHAIAAVVAGPLLLAVAVALLALNYGRDLGAKVRARRDDE